jgi:hypothetical protein
MPPILVDLVVLAAIITIIVRRVAAEAGER